MGKYKTILLDPPWPIVWKKSSQIGTKDLQYQTMPISEICNLPINELAADDCRIFMWTTNQFLPEALGIIRNWKFRYRLLFVWCKNNGIGDRLRVATEYIVIADRGNVQGGDRSQSMILNWLEAKKPQRHSEKPEVFYDIIEKISNTPRLEMFARDREGLFPNRTGWDVYGNEALNSIEIPNNFEKIEARGKN